LIAIHLCSGQRPIAGAHGYPAGQRKNQEAGKDGNCPASARPVRFRRCPPRVPRLTADLFPRFARSYLRSAVRRASRSREAPPQSRLGALLPLSLVGTRSCFSRDRFSQRLGASFSLRRLGSAHRFLRPCRGLRKLRSNPRRFLLHSLRLLGQPTLLPARRGLRALARILAVRFSPIVTVQLGSLPNVFQSASKFHQRSKSVIMPLIELAPRGKDVSLSLTLPEETANDVKLYARFLKATHQSAVSNIVAECVRRTLKQDSEFQTWKADPANTKTNRGGARPRRAGSPSLPQTNKP
jgi:hypothetical protein